MSEAHQSLDDLELSWNKFDRPAVGDQYKHYKGRIYEIVETGFMEASEEPAVIYKSSENGSVWVRLAKEFFSKVNDSTPRFSKIEKSKISHDSETLAEGQQVITACAFIWHDFDGVKKVFLPKRAQTKKFLPGVYELPGGHIDYGEDPVSGLKREIAEELKMQVKIGDPFAVFTYTNDIKKSYSIEVVYFGRLEGDIDEIMLDPEDHESYGWFALAELQAVYDARAQGPDDPEKAIVEKGFDLLNGSTINL